MPRILLTLAVIALIVYAATDCAGSTDDERRGVPKPLWMLIIIVLIDGPCRFSVLKRTIDGISQQMLTRVLKALERDGLISRTTYPTSPPQVEYALTELGLSLSEPVLRLGDWVRDNIGRIEASRETYDAR